jgi:hypothetical protein
MGKFKRRSIQTKKQAKTINQKKDTKKKRKKPSETKATITRIFGREKATFTSNPNVSSTKRTTMSIIP